MRPMTSRRVVRRSRTPLDLDIDEGYERRVKTLYSAIVEFTTRAGDKRLATGDRRPGLCAARRCKRHRAGGEIGKAPAQEHPPLHDTAPGGRHRTLRRSPNRDCAHRRSDPQAGSCRAARTAARSGWIRSASEIEEAARSTTERVDALIRERRAERDRRDVVPE